MEVEFTAAHNSIFDGRGKSSKAEYAALVCTPMNTIL